MSELEYELLKCDDCGKILGHIYITVKTFPPEWWIRLRAGGPIQRVEKTALCEECFQKRRTKRIEKM